MRFFFLSLFLVLASPAFAQLDLTDPALLGHFVRSGSSGGVVDTTFFSESFDGAGYQNPWTESDAAINEDYTANAFAGGGHSLRAQANTFMYTYATIPGKNTYYARFRVKGASYAGGGTKFTLSRNGVADDFTFQIQANGKAIVRHGNSSSTESTTDFSDGSEKFVWIQWNITVGPADNGYAAAWISSTGTKPGSPELEDVSGTFRMGAQPNIVSCQWANNDDSQFKDIKIGDTPYSNF
jgi:hypothetical protein